MSTFTFPAKGVEFLEVGEVIRYNVASRVRYVEVFGDEVYVRLEDANGYVHFRYYPLAEDVEVLPWSEDDWEAYCAL